jgi:hypothetical protein
MRSLFAVILLLISGFSLAQKHPSAILKSIMKANDEGRYEDIRKMLWSKANQEDIVRTLEKTKETYGPANYFLQTDSAYKTSKSQPKKYYEFRFNTYYQHDLFKYEFILVEEKGEYKLASMISHAYKGNYNDPLMNYGALTVPKVFINAVVSGKTKDAYSLFSRSLTESLTEEGFQGMVDIINEALGELRNIDFVDTCTALNFYGENESIAMFAAKLTGTKGNLYFTGTIAMTNDGTFFITRFQLFEELEINNLNEMKAAEKLLDEFYFALAAGAYDKVYALLHPDLQETKSLSSVTELLQSMKTAAGRHKGHSMVSQLFSRNKSSSDLNKFMLIMRDENQHKVMHDNFVMCYDKENKLKISYFYFVEY